MRKRLSVKYQELLQGQLFIGENDDINYWNKSVSILEYVSNKQEYLKRVNKCIEQTQNNYETTSENLVDILLQNHKMFINIGKYVNRMEKNIQKTIDAKNQYGELLNKLMKDVNVFYQEYENIMIEALREKQFKEMQEIKYLETDIEEKNFDGVNFDNQEFDIKEFLEPTKGSKSWIKEQAEKITVYIDDKRFTQAAELFKEIKNFDISVVSYEKKHRIDAVYNNLIDKLINSLMKSNKKTELEEIIFILKDFKMHERAFNSFLLWISRHLNMRLLTAINFLNEVNQENEKINESSAENNNSISTDIESPLKNNNISYSVDNFYLEEDNFDKKYIYEVIQKRDTKNNDFSLKFEKRKSQINLLRDHNGNQIIYLYEHFFESIEKFMDLAEEYFNEENKELIELKTKNIIGQNENKNYYSIYFPNVVAWLKKEIKNFAIKSEILFVKITDLEELKLVFIHLKKIFEYFDLRQLSAKFIFDDCFIENTKIALKSIFNHTFINRNNSKKLLNFEISNKKNEKIEYICIGEISQTTLFIFEFYSYILDEKLYNTNNYFHIHFFEEYFFDKIFTENFINVIKSAIRNEESHNFNIKAINNKVYQDFKNGVPVCNEILNNWSITLLEIHRIISELGEKDKKFNNQNIEKIQKISNSIVFIENLYFSELFKTRVEIHFYHGYSIMKENGKLLDLEKVDSILLDINKNPDFLPEHQKLYYSYFVFLKAMAFNIREKLLFHEYNLIQKYLSYIFLDKLFQNFLEIILDLKDLNAKFSIDFCWKDIDQYTFQSILVGVYFIFNSIHIIFEIEEDKLNLKLLHEEINNLIHEFTITTNKGDIKDEIINNRNEFYKNTKNYIKQHFEFLKKDFSQNHELEKINKYKLK